MEAIICVFIFVIGLCLGSFYNVVGLRIPKKESIVLPGSHCVNCNYELKAYDLIPVFSFLFLKGKCRRCQTTLSWMYPMMELVTGVAFVWSYLMSDNWLTFGFWALLISVMVVLTVSDLAYHLVPDKILLAVFPILVPLGIWVSDEAMGSHLLGGAIFFGGLLFIAFITKGGMGGGDIKLFGLLGLTLGLTNTFVVFILACFTGAIVGYIIKFVKKGTKVIPFVPYIAIGVFFTLLYGDVIWNVIINR